MSTREESSFGCRRRKADPLRLGAIKGVGVKAVEAIVKARGRDRTVQESGRLLRVRIDARGRSGCVETLIRAGAFDSLGARRTAPGDPAARAIQDGQSKQDDRRHGQRGLFDDLEDRRVSVSRHGQATARAGPGSGDDPAAVPSGRSRDVRCRALAGEKKALGFYLSSHPLTRHAALLRPWRPIARPTYPVADKTEVILGGMIANVKVRNVQKSRSGLTRMAKLRFEDLRGSTPAMLWPEEFAKIGEFVKNDQIGS